MAPVTRNPTLDDLEDAINNQAEVFKSSAAAPNQVIMQLLKAYEQRFDVLERNYISAKQELAEVKLQAANAAVERAKQLTQIKQAVEVERARWSADKHDIEHQLNEFRSTISQVQSRVTDEIKSQRDDVLKVLNDKLTELQSSFINQAATVPVSPGFDIDNNDNPMGEDPNDDVPLGDEGGMANQEVPANAPMQPSPLAVSNNGSDAAAAGDDDDDVVMVEGSWRPRDQPITDGDEDKAAVLQFLEQRKSPRAKHTKGPFATDQVGVKRYCGNNYIESLQLYEYRTSTNTAGGRAEGDVDPSSQDSIPQRQSTVATDDSEYIPGDDSVSATPELRNFRPSPIHRPASDPTTLDTISTSPTLQNVVIEPTPSPTHENSDEQRLCSPSAIPVTSQEREQYRSAHRQFGNPRTQDIDNYVRFRKFESNHNGPDSRKRKGEDTLFVSDTETPPQRQRQPPPPPPPPHNAATSTAAPKTPTGPRQRQQTALSLRPSPAPTQANSLANATGNAQRTPKQGRSKSTSAATAAPVLPTMQTMQPQPAAQCSYAGFWQDSANIQSSRASPSNRAQGAPIARMFVDQESADEDSGEFLQRFGAEKRRDSAPTKQSKKP